MGLEVLNADEAVGDMAARNAETPAEGLAPAWTVTVGVDLCESSNVGGLEEATVSAYKRMRACATTCG